MKRFNLNPLVLFVALAALAFAGVTNFNALELNPTAGETNSLLINNNSGTAKVTVTAAGNTTFAGSLTATGAVAISGAQTITEDMTFSGAGKDILTTTDNETSLFTEAASGKDLYVKTVDADTSINTDGTLTVTGTGATTLGGTALIAGKVTVGGVFSLVTSAAASVASATTIAPTKGLSYITGNTAVTGVTIGPWTAGTIQTWCNVGGDATGPALTDGNNLAMAGNLTLGPNDCISFISDGTNLIETNRSVN